MPANARPNGAEWMFVSMSGPTLDTFSSKAVRAHTTKANFAKRRRRLVQEHQLLKTQHPSLIQPGPETPLHSDDALLLDNRA